MDMVEVDPKLFATCRLCLDEMGQFQIVPSVQQQIKYCYDIDVGLFDGLPQLICMKCKDMLIKIFTLKTTLCEKQSQLRSNLLKKAETAAVVKETPVTTQPQHDAVSSSQQIADNTDVPKPKSRIKRMIVSSDSDDSIHVVQSKKKKKKYPKWSHVGYNKYYVCSICKSEWDNIKSLWSHVRVHSGLKNKYQKVLNQNCSVVLKKVDGKPNLTGMNNIVVHNNNKIIENLNPIYYIRYSEEGDSSSSESSKSGNVSETNKIERVVLDVPTKQNDTEFTDTEDEIVMRRKTKKKRTLSKSSTDTVVLESNSNKVMSDDEEDVEEETVQTTTEDVKENQTQNIQVNDPQCINIDDSTDSEGEKTIETRTRGKQPIEASLSDYKVIQGIIAACVKTYYKKSESSDKQNYNESQLKHKVLNIGRKIINSKQRLPWMGLLRYLEHKNLPIEWVIRTLSSGNQKDSNYIRIMTKLRNAETQNDDQGWYFLPASKITSHTKSANDSLSVSLSHQEPSTGLEIKPIMTSNTIPPSMPDIETSVEPDTSVNTEQQGQTVLQNVNDAQSSAILFLCNAADPKSKLLNANPVANPKQLPRKLTQISEARFNKEICVKYQNNEDNDSLPMPIITSTKSLAQDNTEENNTNEESESLLMPIITSSKSLAEPNAEETNSNGVVANVTVQPSAPRIKVKPVSELMSERMLNSLRNEQQSMSVSTSNILANQNNISNCLPSNQLDNMVSLGNQLDNTDGVVLNQVDKVNNIVLNQNVWPQNVSNVYMQPLQLVPLTCVNVTSGPPSYQSLVSNQAPTTSNNVKNKEEYVLLHTTELPNTRTNSPFDYFKALVRLHDLTLLNPHDFVPGHYLNLIKFKVQFKQEPIDEPVLLCLSLFCKDTKYCFTVKDRNQKGINIKKISPNWQWEILNVFRGELVDKVLHNAMKHGPITYERTKNFLCLLKSINFSKLP